MADTEVQLRADNELARTQYLAVVRTFSRENLDPLVADWKKEGRIFSVSHEGAELFPAFQFSDGYPHPEIECILTSLPHRLTPWQIAFWFASGNGWLDDQAPQDRIADVAAVSRAASRLGEPTIG